MLQQLLETHNIRSFFITEVNNQKHVSSTENQLWPQSFFLFFFFLRHEIRENWFFWNITSVLVHLLELFWIIHVYFWGHASRQCSLSAAAGCVLLFSYSSLLVWLILIKVKRCLGKSNKWFPHLINTNVIIGLNQEVCVCVLLLAPVKLRYLGRVFPPNFIFFRLGLGYFFL